jgi:hypothetical protein
MGRKREMILRALVTVALLLLTASVAGCGGEDAADPEASADTLTRTEDHPDSSSPDTAARDSIEHHGRSAEQDHSGAYNLIQDAETAVNDVNRRTRELEASLGDL